jgi:hypothetical protein
MIQQTTSQELTDDLLALLQRKFYQGDAVGFNKDKKQLLIRVVLWPATYLDERGVTLPTERYKMIFTEVIIQALQYGNTGRIKWRPAWLAGCIQSHFKIHWEEIYAEAKSPRSLADNALLSVRRLPLAQAPDPVREMALAAQLLKGTGRPCKRVLKSPLKEQPNLL